MSFVDLPAHVALTILRRLDARDLCALRATCRAFDAALVETAAFEATRARAPWLAAPRPREGPERAPASAKREDESWLDLLRFAELAAEWNRSLASHDKLHTTHVAQHATYQTPDTT